MEKDLTTNGLCFDDILLVPKQSNVATRSNISIESFLGNPNNPDAWVRMHAPIVIAPMEFISSNKMIEKITDSGGIGFINRFQNKEQRMSQLNYLMNNIKHPHLVGFSVNNDDIYKEEIIKEVVGLGIRIILIDTAFAHTQVSIDAVKKLRSLVPSYVHIMTGNISSYEAYKNLMIAGADSVRVGIGGGSACTTRIVTGFGVPTLSSIMDIYDNINKESEPGETEVNGIVADGGIKNNGDVVKSLAAGAAAVMMGSMFSGHDECEGIKDGKFFFRGLASESIQSDPVTGQKPPSHMLHVEGVSSYVDAKGPVESTISLMVNNIKSGMSYCGADNLRLFRQEVKFVQVSYQSLKESGSRI